MPDLEFAVDDRNGNQQIFDSIEIAITYATQLALSDGEEHHVDVLTWTRDAAVMWGGEDAGEAYDEDPEASVHERIVIRATSLGRVP